MEEKLQRVIALCGEVYKEYIDTVETAPEKISESLFAAYQQLDIARAELTKLKHRKEEEGKEVS
jgi:hypothetical protein